MTTVNSEQIRESYQRIRHKSGLEIDVLYKPLTVYHAMIAAKYGSKDVKFRTSDEENFTETPDGTAHYLEHKLFDNPDGSDSFEHFSAFGADANAFTTCDRTSFLFSCTDRFEESLEELLRFVTTPYFTDATVEKERGIITEEIRMYRDSPWERCFQNLLKGLYKNHPARKEICGSEESIAKITPELLYRCYSVFYQPSNMVLAVCGQVTAQQVLEVVDRVLSKDCPKKEIIPAPIHEPDCVNCAKVVDYMPLGKPIFTAAVKDRNLPTDPLQSVRRDAAMSVLCEMLFSKSGNFFNSLFEAGELTASYSCGYSISGSLGYLSVSGESDDPECIFEKIQKQIETVRREGLDREAFERYRRVLYADEIRGFDSTEEIADNLVTYRMDGAELFDYADALRKVTFEELEPLLDSLTRQEAYCLSAVYPLEQKKTAAADKSNHDRQ